MLDETTIAAVIENIASRRTGPQVHRQTAQRSGLNEDGKCFVLAHALACYEPEDVHLWPDQHLAIHIVSAYIAVIRSPSSSGQLNQEK